MNEENVYAPPEANLAMPGDKNILAGRWLRLGGSLIDGIVSMIVIVPVMYVTGYWGAVIAGNLPITDTLMFAIFGFVVFLALHGYFLSTQGQTIGKKLVGTRIVSVESGEILTLQKVFLARYLPISVAANIPLIGSLLVLIDALFIFRKDKRCVHDHIAGTKVVKVNA